MDNVHVSTAWEDSLILGGVLQDLYTDVPVPEVLKETRSFEFLRRNLRAAGSLNEDQ